MHVTNLKQSVSDMPPNVCIHQFNVILSPDVTPVLHTVDLYTLIIYTVYTYTNTSIPKHLHPSMALHKYAVHKGLCDVNFCNQLVCA